MDAELLRLVDAVRDGTIRDVERCRSILHDARTANHLEGEILQAENAKLRAAERAFLVGWRESDVGVS